MKKRLTSILLIIAMVISLIPAFSFNVTAEALSEPEGRGETWDILYSEIAAKGSYFAYASGTKVYFDILPQLYEPSDEYSKYVYFSTYDYAVDIGFIDGNKDDDYVDSCYAKEITIDEIFELPETCEDSFSEMGTLESGGYWVFKVAMDGDMEFFAVKSSGTGDSITVNKTDNSVKTLQVIFKQKVGTKNKEIYFDQKITDEQGLINLFTFGGYGYLANDITLTNILTTNSSASINLFLNGKTINLNENYIYVCNGKTFNLYDNGTTGIIKNGKNVNGGAFEVVDNNSTLNMYGGTIKDCTGQRGGAVHANLGGTFHMYGGLITGNKAGLVGGGVFNHSETSFHMHGGTIEGNYAVKNGGGVYNEENMSFDGKCVVDNNYAGPENNKREENVFTTGSFKLYYDDQIALGLTEGSRVGITYKEGLGQITYAYLNSEFNQAKQTDYFFSDNPDYYVTYNKGIGLGAYLEIVDHKHCVCGNNNCSGDGHEDSQGWIALPSGEYKYFSKEDGPNGDASDYEPFDARIYDKLDERGSAYYLESGYYYLTGDIIVDGPIYIKGDVSICLNGYNISRIKDEYKWVEDGPFIVVYKNCSLTITDCKETQHYFKYSVEDAWEYYGNTAPTSGEIDTIDKIDDDTKYVKLFGGCIFGGKNAGIASCGGDITLINGNIVGNRSREGTGGGVFTCGKFTMTGGNIVGNMAEIEINPDARGGGVFVTVSKDRTQVGDAVSVGQFIMTGGIIGYNITEADEDGYGAAGGGVYVEHSSMYEDFGASGATFTMTGGSIIGNRTSVCSYGGGIYSNGDITISGDAIIEKNIGMYGIWVESFYPYGYSGDEYTPTFTVGGNSQVINNVLTPNGELCNCNSPYDSYITIGTGTNAPGKNMKIGIYPYWDPYSRNLYDLPYVFTTNGTMDDAKYFICDINSHYAKANSENNKLQLVSRITDQPDISNNYTITVDSKNPNVVPSYQWKKAIDTPDGTSSVEALMGDYIVWNNDGSFVDSSYVAALNAGDYLTSFVYWGTSNMQYVTFSSTNTNLELSANDESNSLESDGEGNYIYKTISGDPITNFTILSDSAFTLTNIQFYYRTYENVSGATSRQFVKGVLGEDYLCRVTYLDGSYEDSKKVTFYPYFTESNITKTYGDQNFKKTINASNVTYSSSNPLVATVNSKTGEVTVLKVGTTTIKATIDTGDENVEKTYTLKVVKAKVELPEAISDLTYNGNKQIGVVLATGEKRYSITSNEGTDAGNYTAIATLLDKENYEWKLDTPTTNDQTINWEIAQKTVLVKANNLSIKVGETVPEFTAKVTGLVGEDSILYNFNTINPNKKGVYNIVPSGEESQGNYIVSYEQGELKVVGENNILLIVLAIIALIIAILVALRKLIFGFARNKKIEAITSNKSRYYKTIKDALKHGGNDPSNIPLGETKESPTIIKLHSDVNEEFLIPENRNVIIDQNGYKLNNH